MFKSIVNPQADKELESYSINLSNEQRSHLGHQPDEAPGGALSSEFTDELEIKLGQILTITATSYQISKGW